MQQIQQARRSSHSETYLSEEMLMLADYLEGFSREHVPIATDSSLIRAIFVYLGLLAWEMISAARDRI